MADVKPSPKARIRKSTREGGDSNVQKRLTSDRISADLVDFQKAGGHVEVLGVTRVLKKVDEPAAGSQKPSPA
ncbi:MAG: hypothetical protein ACOH1R_09085 [Luteimonas sp.]